MLPRSENPAPLAGGDGADTGKTREPDHSAGVTRPQGDGVIAIIEKGLGEEIRVARTSYRGRDGIDIRVFERYRTTGELGPTKAGLRVSPELLPTLIAALQAALPR
jgi:hypothetical protein